MTFDLEVKKFLANFVIVSCTSAVAKTITAPLDRIKLILQNQDSALQVIKGQRTRYRGIIDCLIRFPGEQGFLSFWRGNGTNILRYFPTQALNFAFNDFFNRCFQQKIGTETPFKSVLIKFVSGGLAGTCAATIVFPLEFCQTRLAVDVGEDIFTKKGEGEKKVKREFRGLRHCITKIKRKDGIKGLYWGYPIAVVGITLYRAFYFGLFDTFKRLWAQSEYRNKNSAKPPVYIEFLMAQSATCTAGFCCYPIDTVARRIMLDSGRPVELRKFTSPFGAFKKLYQTEGILTFYRGAWTNCLRGMSGALVLVFYDEILHYTKWKEWLSPCDNC